MLSELIKRLLAWRIGPRTMTLKSTSWYLPFWLLIQDRCWIWFSFLICFAKSAAKWETKRKIWKISIFWFHLFLQMKPRCDDKRSWYSHAAPFSSIRTPMLIPGRFERTETNLMHFKWEVTNSRKLNTFYMWQSVNRHLELSMPPPPPSLAIFKNKLVPVKF